MLEFNGTRRGRRRDVAIAAVFVILAASLLLMPPAYQEPVRAAIRKTILSPFIAAQARIAANRARNVDVSRLRAQRDSLAALAIAQSALSEENRRLRGVLELRARSGTRFAPGQVLRLGTAGTESRFIVDVGAQDGVEPGSPVVAPEGLLGVVVEVDKGTSQAIDWSHPNFRVSAMTVDGEAYGIVEARRGRFREEDVLVLTGAPFHIDIRPGTRIVTSGRGELYPRGIPIGSVLGIEEADTGWRKSYVIRPAVRPEAVVTVLVARGGLQGSDVADLWQVTVPGDTAPPPPPQSPSAGARGNDAR